MGSHYRVAPAPGADAVDADTRPDPAGSERARGAVAMALDSLYRDQKPRLLRFFARRAGPQDAQDCAQEAFARYAERTGRGDIEIAEPPAFLNGVAANILRERAKFAVRRSASLHQPYEDDAVSPIDPIAALEARDMLHRIEAAVERLSPRCRKVFLLHRVDGMSRIEIAESTGMSVKAVKKCMAKALFELRRDLGPL